jgi:hypothetical protein
MPAVAAQSWTSLAKRKFRFDSRQGHGANSPAILGGLRPALLRMTAGADKIPAMETRQPLTRAEQDAIRLEFYRAYRGDHGCSSVGVAKDNDDGLYLSVGLVDDGHRIPREYQGLSVRTYLVTRATHAVYQTAS